MDLNQITIPVSDVERSILYYQLLGLKLIVKSLPDYARFECPTGDSTFSLHKSKEEPIGNGIWIYFEVKDVDEKVKALSKNGIHCEEMPNDKPWLWREARFLDPDQHLLILYSAGENRKNPPWRIA